MSPSEWGVLLSGAVTFTLGLPASVKRDLDSVSNQLRTDDWMDLVPGLREVYNGFGITASGGVMIKERDNTLTFGFVNGNNVRHMQTRLSRGLKGIPWGTRAQSGHGSFRGLRACLVCPSCGALPMHLGATLLLPSPNPSRALQVKEVQVPLCKRNSDCGSSSTCLLGTICVPKQP